MSSDGNHPWLARLRCGHDARLAGQPQAGTWITCPSPHCQGQRRVVAVLFSGDPGCRWTQEALFSLAEAGEAA